jgi:hypothetical protein
VPVAHLVNGQVDYAHSVAASLTALPGGCSATAGSGSYSGTDYARTACHYSDIIQEHNRKIESGPNGTVVQTISVTCAQCHESDAFKALNGKWDGTCDACHTGTTAMPNHSVVGSSEYNRVHGLHQAPSYYSSGTNSSQGLLIAGTNTMDAHGPLRTAAVAAHPGAFKPIGCAQAFCHQNAYMKPGSGFYTATTCTQCHPANTATANSPSGTMVVNYGAVFVTSTAVTVNSAIIATGGATLTSMAVDPGTGVYGSAIAYSASYGISLPSGNGMKTVRVKYTDSSARTSTFSTVIWLTSPPQTINASVSGGNGTISPAGATAVVYGTSQTFTFAASDGYHLGTLTVDGSPVSSPGATYTFSNVSAPHSIVVTFAKNTYAWSGYGVDGPAGTTYVTGMTLSLGALPANSALTFNAKWDIETGYDYGYVQVSTDGGSTWTNIAGTGTSNVAGAADGPGNAGNGIFGLQAAWIPASYDLSAYSGKAVKLRLTYACDSGFFGNDYNNPNYPTSGWFVSNLAVGPTGAPVFSDDFSTTNAAWVVTSNTPGHSWLH